MKTKDQITLEKIKDFYSSFKLSSTMPPIHNEKELAEAFNKFKPVCPKEELIYSSSSVAGKYYA